MQFVPLIGCAVFNFNSKPRGHAVVPKTLALTQPKESNISTIVVPDTWVDFASSCEIRSGTKFVKFIPYHYQIKLIDLIESHVTTVIAKTRQLGITETISNYFLWKALKNPAYLSVIFSKNQDDTSNIAKRLRKTIESIPGAKLKTDAVTDLQFIGGGRILFRNSTVNGARGLESVSDLFFDEAAFVEDIREIYASSTPCTSMVGDSAKIIINSTPNGQAGWYYDKLRANNNDKDVLAIAEEIRQSKAPPYMDWTASDGWGKALIHWKAHPIYSQDSGYLDKVQSKFGVTREAAEQEYDLSFVSGETLVFKTEDVYMAGQGDRNTLPDPKGIYYAGLDVSGVGNDYTVFSLLKEVEMPNGSPMYQLVNWYRDRKKSNDYNLSKMHDLIEAYNPREIWIETNSMGQIYYEQLASKYSTTTIHPFNTNRTTKIHLISRLLLALERRLITVPRSSPHYGEFFDFRVVDQKYQAISGKYDDCLISLSLALSASPFRLETGATFIDVARY